VPIPRVCYGFASLPTGNCGEVNLHLVKTASTCIIHCERLHSVELVTGVGQWSSEHQWAETELVILLCGWPFA